MKFTILLLFFIGSSAAFSQSFEILNVYDSPVGSDYSFIESSLDLPSTMLHIANISDSDKTFTVNVAEISNPTNVTLQVCFGGGCFIVAAGSVDGYSPPAFEAISSDASFDNFKIGPSSYSWEVGDSAVWDLTVINQDDLLDSTEVRLTWKSNSLVGISEDTQLSKKLSLFPNPANDIINVKISDNTIFKEVSFINAQGKEIYRSKFSTQLNVSEIPAGLYVIQFIDEADNYTFQKVLIE